MSKVVYNVPVSLVDVYRKSSIIVRSEDADSLVKVLSEIKPYRIVAVQLLSLTVGADSLADWGYAVPVELVMLDPEEELPFLYRHAKLAEKHPVRVSIPVVAGLSKAVKAATALGFVVKLELGQPTPAGIGEMREVLRHYLRHSSVSQPVEFFHSTLQAFYYRNAATLWEIQEEDPACIRYVEEDGREVIGRRPGSEIMNGDPNSFVAALKSELLAERGECYWCEFFENCGGYFKWPSREYRCDGIKVIFNILRNASEELKRDLYVSGGMLS